MNSRGLASYRIAALVSCVLVAVLLAGCGSKKTARATVPSPPEITAEADRAGVPAAPSLPAHPQALYVETGVASWYGPPYHNRRGSNGEVFDMNALTAAHRTLPLNSVARVTNLETGHAAVVRITDRGPFIEGRMLDLSLAAAKKVDVWRPGTAKVRLEVLQAPASITDGGRWCVQIGAFSDKNRARRYKESLQRRYHDAQVLQFTGPTGDWIRVRVQGDDRKRATAVLRDARSPEGAAFLVRLD